ncbi:retrotransposon protein, putative, ty1-copia subclass [Tanacetum coccineum]
MTSSFINSSKIATAITCKLTRTNFLLWKAQVVPILRGVQLYGYVDGTKPMPAITRTIGTGADARQATNPDYEAWVVQDQAILGALLSSMTEDVLSQITRCTDTVKHNYRSSR